MNKKGHVHLEIQKHRANPYGVIRSSYRDENNKIKHVTHGRINGLGIEQLKVVQAALQNKAVLKSDFKILNSKEYGASFACLQIAKEIGLDKMIYSKPYEQWVKDCLAMIVGRLIYAGSKLSLSKIHKDSSLWELCGVEVTEESGIDVNVHCYDAMDRLFERQDQIQKKLASKNTKDGAIVLYDITSSYLEGDYEESDIIKYGYNRDKKRGKKQIVIGLLCNSEGCPFAVEIFNGNTKDETTVMSKIHELKETYKLKDIVFVGDRGMVTKSNFEKIDSQMKIISAITHSDVSKLLENNPIQVSLFDEKNVIEIFDKDNPRLRYGLCLNPVIAKKESEKRIILLEKTKESLDKIVNSKRNNSKEQLGVRVGKVINKYKMGKFVIIEQIEDKNFKWRFDNDKIEKEASLDGYYAVYTDVPSEEMEISEVVKNYKNLIQVEQAFRNMKSVTLEIRPIYHRTDERIKCHAFICMLAYYIMWNMKTRLQPLFDADLVGKNREYSFNYIIERLKSIRSEKVLFDGVQSCFITDCDNQQKEILSLLNIKM